MTDFSTLNLKKKSKLNIINLLSHMVLLPYLQLSIAVCTKKKNNRKIKLFFEQRLNL